MSKAVRKYRRGKRRNQRRARRDYNKKLKSKGYSWAQRRRMVRNRRRYDRNVRKKGVANRRMRKLDRNVESPRERRMQAKPKKKQGTAPLPPPPPPPPSSRAFPPTPRWGPSSSSMVPGRGRPMPLPGPPLLPGPVAPPRGPSIVRARPGPSVVPAWDVPERALEVDAYDTYEPYDPYYDAMENAVLVDEGYWDNDPVEYDYDVADVAGEIAGMAYEALSGGHFGADDDVESVIDNTGLRLLAEIKLYAVEDGWTPEELAVESAKVIDATNAVEQAVEVSGGLDGIGAAGALMAIPALASLATPFLEMKAKANERRAARGGRRNDRRRKRQERRAAELEERIEELERLGPGSGVLDVNAEDWGPSAKTDNVLVRARHGKRAALASLGNGYYLVREVGPDEPQAAVQTEISRAATLAAPALSAIQAVSGDAYTRCKCQGGWHG